MRLAGIDLNLLTSLHALLETQSVTRAAKQLGLSQPAVSHTLRRLRELLGDELLVRTPRGMAATPRANELRSTVRAALDAAEAVLRAAPAFDPATAERTFVIAMADQVAYLMLPRLMARVSREAPGVRIEVRGSSLHVLGEDVDLAIGLFLDEPASARDEPLLHEQFVCVLRAGNPAARGAFDTKRFLALHHLLVAPRGLPGSAVDDLLASRGQRRHVAIVVPHFLVAPHIIAATDLVWTAPASLAHVFAKQLPLAVREPPFRIGGFTLSLRWHARLDGDRGLAWLRETLKAVAP